jgi:uncharacterized protein HemX
MSSSYFSQQAKHIKRYARVVFAAAAIGCLALPLGAQTRTLEDIKAEAKAQVRRELGLDSKASSQTERDNAVKKIEEAPDIPVPGDIRKEDILKLAAGGAVVLVLVLGIIFWKPGKKKNKKRTQEAATKKLPREEGGLNEEEASPAMPEKTVPGAAEGETAIDIYDKIERLQQLREKGAITEDEFASKKKELLDRI